MLWSQRTYLNITFWQLINTANNLKRSHSFTKLLYLWQMTWYVSKSQQSQVPWCIFYWKNTRIKKSLYLFTWYKKSVCIDLFDFNLICCTCYTLSTVKVKILTYNYFSMCNGYLLVQFRKLTCRIIVLSLWLWLLQTQNLCNNTKEWNHLHIILSQNEI